MQFSMWPTEKICSLHVSPVCQRNKAKKKQRVDIVVNESCACDFRTQLHGWICLLHMVKHTNMAKIINKSRNEISPIAFFTQTVIIFWLCTGDSKAAHSPTPQLQVNDRRMSNVKNTKEKETSMLFSSLVYPTKKRRKENHSTSRKTRISFHQSSSKSCVRLVKIQLPNQILSFNRKQKEIFFFLFHKFSFLSIWKIFSRREKNEW